MMAVPGEDISVVGADAAGRVTRENVRVRERGLSLLGPTAVFCNQLGLGS